MLCGGGARVARVRRRAGRPVRAAGRAARSVPAHRVRCRQGRAWTPTRWRRRPSWPSASRCDGQVTDDSHQPPQPDAGEAAPPRLGQRAGRVGPEDHRRLHADPRAGRAGRRLVVLVAAQGSQASSTDDIAAAEHETARLQTLIVQVQQFEERKAQLQQRVTLIEQLRRGQSGPVHMLDESAGACPRCCG